MIYARKFLLEKLPLSIDRYNNVNIKEKFVGDKFHFTAFNDAKFYIKELKKNRLYEVNEEYFYNEADKFADSFLERTRYYVPLTARIVANIDVYNNIDVQTATVHLDNLEEYADFVIPEWFGMEVTHNQVYDTENLLFWTRFNNCFVKEKTQD